MKTRILAYLEKHLPSDLFIVGVTLSKTNNHINVYLDGDAGITVDTCGKISRELESWLDEADEIPQEYTLNVSSAGLDHPLVNERQFKKNVNRNLSVQTVEAIYKGQLVLAGADGLMLKVPKKHPIPFKYSEIQEAKVEI